MKTIFIIIMWVIGHMSNYDDHLLL